MTRAVARTYAVTGLGLTIAAAIGTALVQVFAPAPFISEAFGFGPTAMVGFVIEGLCWASIGALLVIRRPGNAVGWLMVIVGIGHTGSQLSISIASAFAAEGSADGVRLAQLAGWVTVLLQLVGVCQVAIGFLYPDGRVQSRGWILFMRSFWAFAVAFVAISLTQPGPLQLVPALQNPFGFGPDLRGDRPMAPIVSVLTVFIFAGLGISMTSRYRSAGTVERHQLKWFAMALGVSSIGLGILTTGAIFNSRPVDATGLTVYVFASVLVPFAIGIAILRYRLYDIDRIISRTLSYGAVTAVLALVFALAGGGLGVVLGSLAVAEGQTIAVAASTLIVVALFGPLRRRAQDIVDRRFDRSRYDASLTVEAMTERLRDDVDLARVKADVLGVVDRTFHPATVGVWLRRASG